MKYNEESVQPTEGVLTGNNSIFGKDSGRAVKKLPSRSQHKKTLKANPSDHARIAMEKHEIAKNIAREICGYSPYEKRAMDLGRLGEEKKMKKFLKKRLGTLKAAKRKQEILLEDIRKH
ncbi:large subunit ribosomal protein L36e [Nematocida sp. LUAm3]|nr:large subunit ribosomal protein L36e [Nematocida sp. LUAm3]KAI5175175.1 large subunit ribosomal protein L36e [Nematocida sp. LUAm2]KAI5178153.1 large subunit ribosomal protein L36e [Nematocida sp. LUAm1]